MLKCIIIEDQQPAFHILTRYIRDTPELSLIKAFTDAVEAKVFLLANEVDLMFLDINLPQLSGLDFLKIVHNPPPSILTTAYSDYALESYEYNVVDYLLKPFSFDRFMQAVDKAKTFVQGQIEKKEMNENEIYIKTGHDIIKIKYDDVLHIKSDTDYTEILTNFKKHLSSTPLKEWLIILDNNFCQVHKSHIVNLSHISRISQNKIYLSQGVVIPLGRSFKKEFLKRKLNIKNMPDDANPK